MVYRRGGWGSSHPRRVISRVVVLVECLVASPAWRLGEVCAAGGRSLTPPAPSLPPAGFSKQMVEILQRHNIQFSSFDIFSDEEVRQGLKTFSNWPTYPQLYVSGELIGGLDIVKVSVEKCGRASAVLLGSLQFPSTDVF